MKHKLKIILFDLLYFLLFTTILISSRIMIQGLLVDIQNYGSELGAVDVNQNIEVAQSILSSLSSVTTKAYILIFVLIPLILFTLYIVFQSLAFKKEKFSYKNFILYSSIPFILLVLTISFLKLYLFILFIVFSYLSLVLYFYKIKELKISYQKIYKLFPIYFLYLILSFLAIGFFYLSYTRIVIHTEFIVILLFAIIFSITFSVYKLYLIRKLS